MRKFLFIVIIIIILLFLYGRYIEPNNLKINEFNIKDENIPKSFQDLKMIHFSDLLYDKDEKKLDKFKTKINSLEPDIIFFTGDLFNKNYKYDDKDYNNLKSFLKSLNANLYKYAVIGDNDKVYLDKYQEILIDSDFILLNNENFLLFFKDVTPINIIGLNDNYNISELLTSDIDFNYTIVLTNRPDEIINLSNYNINLILAGHSLGGIINIPYYGGLIKRDGANTYINNYYRVNNTDLYISNGIGYDNFAFRLFNTPSISVFRFSN